MALLSVNSLDMGFGEDDLFLNMSFEIQPGDRIGLIGVNGSGKTTLFKLLVGDYKPNKGTISLGKGYNYRPYGAACLPKSRPFSI